MEAFTPPASGDAPTVKVCVCVWVCVVCVYECVCEAEGLI